MEFARSIRAVTLFGRGFGELIKSPSTPPIRVPKGFGYLGASAADLEVIFRDQGNSKGTPFRLAEGLCLYSPEDPFESSHSTPQPGQPDFPVQETKLYQKNWWKTPDQLKPGATVVFGHNPRSRPDLGEIVIVDSGIADNQTDNFTGMSTVEHNDYSTVDAVSTTLRKGKSESTAQGPQPSDSLDSPGTPATSLSGSQLGQKIGGLQSSLGAMLPTPLGTVSDDPHYEDDSDNQSQRSFASNQTSASSMESYTAIFINWLRQIIEERLQWESIDDLTLLKKFLPDTLREFSTRLSQNGQSDSHKKVMWFIHVMCGSHNSSDSIVMRTLEGLKVDHSFTEDNDAEDTAGQGVEGVNKEIEGVNEEIEDVDSDDNDRDKSSSMSVDEKMEVLMQSQQSLTDAREHYRNILQDLEEEAWFLSNLEQHRGLGGIDPFHKKAIRRSVIKALRRKPVVTKGAKANKHYADLARISPKNDAPTSTAHFEVLWNPAAFVQEVRNPSSDSDIEWPRGDGEKPKLPLLARLVTVTGHGNRLQALPCREYMIQTWPPPMSSTPVSFDMPPLLLLICRLVEDPNSHQIEPIGWGSSIQGSLHHRLGLRVSVHGTDYEIAEIAEQLAWLGSALRAPTQDGIISVCYPELAVLPPSLPAGDHFFSMSFKLDKSLEKALDSDDGLNMCWTRFFKKLTVAQGYPIPSRPDGFDGLQIPLHHAAKMIRARRIDRFRSRHMIKGYSTALYPTGIGVSRQDIFIAWHFIENEDGSRLSYTDPRLGEGGDESVKPLRHDDIMKASHIIGWCAHVKNVAGMLHEISNQATPFGSCKLISVSCRNSTRRLSQHTRFRPRASDRLRSDA